MPPSKARKNASKKSRRNVVKKVMHELNLKSSTPRSQKQKIAIALERAGLSRKKKKRKKKK